MLQDGVGEVGRSRIIPGLVGPIDTSGFILRAMETKGRIVSRG